MGGDLVDDLKRGSADVTRGEAVVAVGIYYDWVGGGFEGGVSSGVFANRILQGPREIPSVAYVDGYRTVDCGDRGYDRVVPFVHPRSTPSGFIAELDPHYALQSTLFDLLGDEGQTSLRKEEIQFISPELCLTSAYPGMRLCVCTPRTGVKIEEDSYAMGVAPAYCIDDGGPGVCVYLGRGHGKRGILGKCRAEGKVADRKAKGRAMSDSGEVMEVPFGQRI